MLSDRIFLMDRTLLDIDAIQAAQAGEQAAEEISYIHKYKLLY